MWHRPASLTAILVSFLSACATTHSGSEKVAVELAPLVVEAPAAEILAAAKEPSERVSSADSIYFDPAAEPALYSGPSSHEAEGSNSLATFFFGIRRMEDEVAWDGLENPGVFGGEVVLQPATSPLGLELGLQFATDSAEVGAVDIDSTFIELYVGGRLTGDFGGVHPYIGAGGTWLYADVTSFFGGFEASDDDGTFGGYAHAGLLFDYNSLVLGLDARAVFGTDVELVGVDSDVDYQQLTLFFGTRF